MSLTEFLLNCGFQSIISHDASNEFSLLLNNVPYKITLTNDGLFIRSIEIVSSRFFNTKKRYIGSDMRDVKSLTDIERLIMSSSLYSNNDKRSSFQALLNHMQSVVRKNTIDEILTDLENEHI